MCLAYAYSIDASNSRSRANASMTPEGFPFGGGEGARGPGGGFSSFVSAFLVTPFAGVETVAGIFSVFFSPCPEFRGVVVAATVAPVRTFDGFGLFIASWPYDEKLGSASRSR